MPLRNLFFVKFLILLFAIHSSAVVTRNKNELPVKLVNELNGTVRVRCLSQIPIFSQHDVKILPFKKTTIDLIRGQTYKCFVNRCTNVLNFTLSEQETKRMKKSTIFLKYDGMYINKNAVLYVPWDWSLISNFLLQHFEGENEYVSEEAEEDESSEDAIKSRNNMEPSSEEILPSIDFQEPDEMIQIFPKIKPAYFQIEPESVNGISERHGANNGKKMSRRKKIDNPEVLNEEEIDDDEHSVGLADKERLENGLKGNGHQHKRKKDSRKKKVERKRRSPQRRPDNSKKWFEVKHSRNDDSDSKHHGETKKHSGHGADKKHQELKEGGTRISHHNKHGKKIKINQEKNM